MITIIFWIVIILLTPYVGFRFWLLIEEFIVIRQLKSFLKNYSSPTYTEEEVKFIATRFRHACSLKGLNTNDDTVNFFNEWFSDYKKKFDESR